APGRGERPRHGDPFAVGGSPPTERTGRPPSPPAAGAYCLGCGTAVLRRPAGPRYPRLTAKRHRPGRTAAGHRPPPPCLGAGDGFAAAGGGTEPDRRGGGGERGGTCPATGVDAVPPNGGDPRG